MYSHISTILTLVLATTILGSPVPQDDGVLILSADGNSSPAMPPAGLLNLIDATNATNTTGTPNTNITISEIATPDIPKPACQATNHGIFNSYNVQIALAYDKNKCMDIKHTVQGEIGLLPLMWFKCKFDEADKTLLKFDYWFYNANRINKGLQKAFPAVGDGEGEGFDCPDY